MPKESRRRYQPQDVDLSQRIDLEELASALMPTKRRWEEVSVLDRLGEAAGKLRAIDQLRVPDLMDPDAHEYYEQWVPDDDDILEPDSPDRNNLPELQGRIKQEEFERLMQIAARSEGLHLLRPDLGETEYVISQYVMPAFRKRLLETHEELDCLGSPFRSLVEARVVAVEFLEWLYEQVADTPEAVPSEDEMAEQLVAAASEILSKERMPLFRFGKRLTLDAVALGIVQSLMVGSQDRTPSIEVYYLITHKLDEIAAAEHYDPLSKPVLGLLLDHALKILRQEHCGGIGDKDPWEIAKVFTPRELVVLEACARHWTDPNEWSWEEVLRETGLGSAFEKQMIKDTSVKVRDKLEKHQEIRIGLGIPQNFSDW